MTFKDREDAGRLLAFALAQHIKSDERAVVVGLPRGGVIVAAEIAHQLNAPLDFIVVRKIGHPDNPEFAVGAVGLREVFLNPEVTVPSEFISDAAKTLRKEILQRERSYRGGKLAQQYRDKTIVLADDGIATGLTMKAAIAELRAQRPKRIVLATPVAAADALAALAHDVDDVVCLYTPSLFMAVGQFYESFPQVSDSEVVKALQTAGRG